MHAVRRLTRAAIVVLLGAGTVVWHACDRTAAPSIGPAPAPDFGVALIAQRRHTDALLATPGVVGTAVTRLVDGRAGVLVLLERPDVAGLPQALDGVPVTLQVTGRLMAFSDPTKRQRPAPTGFSVGHPAITAGTIGARVRDALGRVYILSNNHVLANSNGATIGDPEYQPGPFDGGTAADQIATLTDFQTITFSTTANNTIDAAIALSDVAVLDNATPADDGYGLPNANMYGDGDGDGVFDDRNALLGLNVQKYGRTTHLTHGQITGVNATVSVCYEVSGFECTKLARFVDQLIVTPGTFSGGGDSGSLLVTDDANLNPVALLFAGSSTVTIANRIDLVLLRFGVTIDGSAPPPPGPLTDLAVTSMSGPNLVIQGSTAAVNVTVKNVGNQDVPAFDVTLQDATEHVTVGTQHIAGLTAGAATTLTYSWTPAATGNHDLVASQSLADDRATNDQRSMTIPVTPPVTDVAVTSISTPGTVIVGHTVSVGVTVANVGNQNVTSGFTVTLRDATANVTLGTQTVTGGLTTGAGTTLSFTWNTTNATLGAHSLVSTHTLTDDNAANNQLSSPVTVAPKPTDIALTDITAPSRVTQGETAHVLATVKNVGEVDVGTSFNVVLTDGTAGGATIGTQSVAGLAVGATTIVDFPWNTTGADTVGHILFAAQKLADDNAANNTLAIGIIVTAPPSAPSSDVAVTGVNAPSAVTQGATATVGVIVQNVGGQNVTTGFNVVLTDQTAGVTLGTQTVTGLAVGASATLSFTWNTTGAVLGGHTLVATHTLTDGNATNNQGSAVVTVNPPGVTDVAVTAVNAPASVTQGSTAAIGVTVQNVGGQGVTSSFNVVLTDQTAGVTLGTQTVTGLAVGASSTLSFSWNTTAAALGGHTLVATHSLTDDNAANNQASATVTVVLQPPDLALTDITAPSQVTQGETAPVVVTVQNVGGQNVTTSFDVVLTDGSAGGVIIGTQTIAGLAAGTSATQTFNWNTAGTTTGGHILIATQKLADNDPTNNARAIGITVQPQPSADVAVTAVSAPASVTQGSTAAVGVTVQNVGGENVTTGFNVVLTDQTAGVTLGTQTVSGLAVGAGATLSFTWNTTAAALAGHTLVATHNLTDANPANNQGSAVVTVTPPITDVAVTAVNAPAAVTQGSSTTIGVTVQNVGGQNVSAGFNVVLTDQTAGVTLGTQTVSGLAVGASATLSFSWNTTTAALGGHTLVATQSLTDDDAANNQRSAVVTITLPPADLALTAITAPAQVTQGETAPVVVTVQNVGGQNVGSFDVVLTDGSAGGVIIGMQTIAGLAVGAAASRTFNWNTTGAATGGHILIATQQLADNDASNNARAIGITVNAPSVHVGNLNGSAVKRGNIWSATVTITAHDFTHALRNGVSVSGNWNGSSSTVGQCSTSGAGTCSVVLSSIPNSTAMVSFAVTTMTLSGYVYNSSANHDPDGSSNGFSIIVKRP
jgi:hypothetical protein